MLQAYRGKAGEFALEPLTIRLLGTHLHARRALDLFVDIGHRKAALFRHLDPIACHNLRVDVDLGLVLLGADVHDQERSMHVDLGSGQSDTRGGVHGLQHVRDQLPERGVELLHRLGPGTQPGVGKLQYWQQGHECSLFKVLKCWEICQDFKDQRPNASRRDPVHKVGN